VQQIDKNNLHNAAGLEDFGLGNAEVNKDFHCPRIRHIVNRTSAFVMKKKQTFVITPIEHFNKKMVIF